MSRPARALSEALMRQVVRSMPAERCDWAQAMCAEIDHLDSDRAALGFALGCVWASGLQSLRSMNALTALGRYGLAAATALAAAVGLVFWAMALPRYADAGLSPPAILTCGLLIAYLAAAALALARGGPALLVRVVWAALALTSAHAMTLTVAFMVRPGGLRHQAYFQALVIEDYAALVALLGAGMALQSAPQWRWLRAWAIYR